MLTIYSEKITRRLLYTLSIIFDDRKITWQLTDKLEDFKQSKNPKLNYSNAEYFKDCTNIIPATILFEAEIIPHKISKVKRENIELLDFNGIADILSSIFYVVSLYDDYLQTEKDKHGRNIGENSLLFKMGWIEKLIIEKWIVSLIKKIESDNKTKLNADKIPFKTIPTFDIDNAYAFLLKNGFRKFLSIGKDLIKNNNYRMVERRLVLKGQRTDPYDTYKKMEQIVFKGFNIKVFWLLGTSGKYDRNISPKNIQLQELIKKVSDFADIGLHPSYESNTNKNLLETEKKQLEEILNRKVTHSRQHFLKIHLPETFIQLEKAGFTDDYSLSYADVAGFRAGISRPFYWFNLPENKMSKLLLHPITYMDGTLNDYQQLSISEAMKTVKRLKLEIQEYGGEFIPLWHNETIGDYGRWRGWKEVLDFSLE